MIHDYMRNHINSISWNIVDWIRLWITDIGCLVLLIYTAATSVIRSCLYPFLDVVLWMGWVYLYHRLDSSNQDQLCSCSGKIYINDIRFYLYCYKKTIDSLYLLFI